MPEKYKYESFALVLDTEENNLFSPYELYHENSKFDKDVSLPEFQKIVDIRSNPELITVMARAFREYPGCPVMPLPLDAELGELTLSQAIRYRRTVRHFTNAAISLPQLSAILLYSGGITGQFTYTFKKPEIQYLRAAPSAGALYPIEIYPVVLNVTDCEQGIYHYNVKDHALVQLRKQDCHELIPPLLTGQVFTKECAVIFLLTAIFKRTTIKYGQRGYRFVLLDAGHIAQNIYLCATSFNLGCVALGGFYDREMEEILNLDGVEESLVYALAIGHRSEDQTGLLQMTNNWT
jgi:SagB-type dehydrogenase family enzyme